MCRYLDTPCYCVDTECVLRVVVTNTNAHYHGAAEIALATELVRPVDGVVDAIQPNRPLTIVVTGNPL